MHFPQLPKHRFERLPDSGSKDSTGRMDPMSASSDQIIPFEHKTRITLFDLCRRELNGRQHVFDQSCFGTVISFLSVKEHNCSFVMCLILHSSSLKLLYMPNQDFAEALRNTCCGNRLHDGAVRSSAVRFLRSGESCPLDSSYAASGITSADAALLSVTIASPCALISRR